MATYGYTRVSTKAQSEDGESLAVQERMLGGYCMMHGLEVARTFVEQAVSGSVPLCERPEGKALLGILKPGDKVIASKLDRMFRSARDALEVADRFKAMGVELHLLDIGGSVTSNGTAKLFFTMVSAFAEFERDRIRERITQVKQDQKARGAYLGGRIPFGYTRIDGAMVEVPEQQAAITTARSLRASGAVLREIREALIAQHGVKLSLDAIVRITAEAV